MSIGEGLLAGVAGVAVIVGGVVVYKVVKKKRPQLLRKVNRSLRQIKETTFDVAADARNSFLEGYAKT